MFLPRSQNRNAETWEPLWLSPVLTLHTPPVSKRDSATSDCVGTHPCPRPAHHPLSRGSHHLPGQEPWWSRQGKWSCRCSVQNPCVRFKGELCCDALSFLLTRPPPHCSKHAKCNWVPTPGHCLGCSFISVLRTRCHQCLKLCPSLFPCGSFL